MNLALGVRKNLSHTYILYFYDHRYASPSGQSQSLSPQKSSLNLQMPLGQRQDGKPFLDFGKKMVGRNWGGGGGRSGGGIQTYIHSLFVNVGREKDGQPNEGTQMTSTVSLPAEILVLRCGKRYNINLWYEVSVICHFTYRRHLENMVLFQLRIVFL